MTRLDEIEARLVEGYSSDCIWDEVKGNSYACLKADSDVRYLLDEVKRLQRTENNVRFTAMRLERIEMPNLAKDVLNLIAK